MNDSRIRVLHAQRKKRTFEKGEKRERKRKTEERITEEFVPYLEERNLNKSRLPAQHLIIIKEEGKEERKDREGKGTTTRLSRQ